MFRKAFIIITSIIVIIATFAGATSALENTKTAAVKSELSNVRAYAPTVTESGNSYAVDGGELFKGAPNAWQRVETPAGIIVNAVAADTLNPDTVYIGAANEMAIYRSTDGGATWLAVPLSQEHIGAVTTIAVDSVQRLVYVGTDTAGLFRLRDVGSSMILSGHLLLDEPVLEIVADSTGAGMAFARTEWSLYRSAEYGLRWETVENLGSVPTALAMANGNPATIYVGTTDRGLLKSSDGLTWETANAGLGMAPGTRLQVDALALDPTQPEVLYVATSYLFGSTTVHQTPVGVSMSTDNAVAWTPLGETDGVAVAELLPVSGMTGAVYALTTQSRTPLAMGDAPAILTVAEAPVTEDAAAGNGLMAWIVAGLAALALAFAVAYDLRKRRPATVTAGEVLSPRMVEHKS